MLVSEGLSKSDCNNEVIISDTTSPGSNAINTDSWYAATDNEGVGSKVIKDAVLENGSINTSMYVGNFSYPNGPWTSGKLAGNIGYDIDGYDYVKITYKSTIDLIFELPMPVLDSQGKNFGKRIGACHDYRTLILDINSFEKPTWAVSDATKFDKSKVSTVSFRTFLADGENVDISLKEVKFYKKTVTGNKISKLSFPNNKFQTVQNLKSLQIKTNFKGNANYKILSPKGQLIKKGKLKEIKEHYYINNLLIGSGIYILNIISDSNKEQLTGSFKWEN